MDIKYRLLSKNDEDHSIIVRYWTNTISEESLSTDFDNQGNPILDETGHPVRCRTDYNFTLYNHNNPTEYEILDIIERGAPVSFLRLMETKKSDPSQLSLQNAIPLIGVDRTLVIPDEQQNVFGV